MVLHEEVGSGREVQDMHEDSTTALRCACGRSDGGGRSEGGTAPRISFEPLFVCNADG